MLPSSSADHHIRTIHHSFTYDVLRALPLGRCTRPGLTPGPDDAYPAEVPWVSRVLVEVAVHVLDASGCSNRVGIRGRLGMTQSGPIGTPLDAIGIPRRIVTHMQCNGASHARRDCMHARTTVVAPSHSDIVTVRGQRPQLRSQRSQRKMASSPLVQDNVIGVRVDMSGRRRLPSPPPGLVGGAEA